MADKYSIAGHQHGQCLLRPLNTLPLKE